ncbi:MAG: CIA30 family protein [Flavobacteriaceae bacterium]
MNEQLIFDFNRDANIENWLVVDDGVMGGRSKGNLSITPEGHGLFEGKVSLENNGGFSSLRHRFDSIAVDQTNSIRIRLKGDGKRYQFRVKNSTGEYFSYVSHFESSGNWEEIVIPLKDMVPQFRGRRLDLPNFAHKQIEEIAFLIGNKKAESFSLLIDSINLD